MGILNKGDTMLMENVFILIMLFAAALASIYLFSDDLTLSDNFFKIAIGLLIIVLILLIFGLI